MATVVLHRLSIEKISREVYLEDNLLVSSLAIINTPDSLREK